MIKTSNHVMELKLERTEEIMKTEVVDLLIVVNVVHFQFEAF